jgi:hypothetical protein
MSLILVYAVGGTALAEEPQAPAAGAPSTMNGELVKVGDRNEFEYSFKRFNVSTNPIGWILGEYGASISYAVAEIVALRFDANYSDPAYIDDFDVKGLQVAVAAPIYFRKMYKGLFLEPALQYMRMKASEEGMDSVSANIAGPSVSVGYHWYWDSGLNISTAFGVGRNFASSDEEEFSALNKIYPTGYLRFGYAF